MKKRDERVEASGIIGLNSLQKLGEAGLTVVWKDDLDRLKAKDELDQMIIRWAKKKMAEEVREEESQ